MYKKYVLFLFVFTWIIPQISDGVALPWRTWLNMHSDLEAIVKCESNFKPKAIGDHGKSYGIFQINLPTHPEITKAQAKDPYWSINWAIDQQAKGNLGIWTCAKLLSKQGKIISDL